MPNIISMSPKKKNWEDLDPAEQERRLRIGYNFRRLRNFRGWSPKYMAEKGDVQVSQISQIQKGRVGFAEGSERKWAAIFQCDPSEFYKPIDPDRQAFEDYYENATETERKQLLEYIKERIILKKTPS
jgi:transcriptional regulator with XRE-family HTH domain